MVSRRWQHLVGWAPTAVAVIALLVIGWGLSAQASLAADLGDAMDGVLANLKEARRLTGKTVVALAPLKATAATVESMNGRVSAIANDVMAMNRSLDQVTSDQRAILSSVESLNNRTAGLTAYLIEADGQNRRLLALSSDLAELTEGQEVSLRRLWTLTGHAIGHLATVNQRLSFLRSF